jgi:FlaG/FlaF family flagellin (archaellin)
MVAVTVIVAATIAVFVLDIGESTSGDVPAGSFSAEQKEMRLEATGGFSGDFYVLEIAYTSGDPIPEDQLTVRVNGRQAWGVTNGSRATQAAALLDGSSSSLEAGQSLTVVHTDDPRITISESDEYVINQPSPSGTINPVKNDNDPEKNRLFHAPNAPYLGPPSPQLQLRPGDRVTITWESERGDETALLFEQEVESVG